MTTNNQLERLAYSIPEAAQIIGICKSGVYAAIRSGNLDARKIGRRTVIIAESLREYRDRLPQAKLA